MKPVSQMSDDELRDAFRARCIGWLAADKAENNMAMFCHATIQGLILQEWDARLRARARRERPMLSVVR